MSSCIVVNGITKVTECSQSIVIKKDRDAEGFPEIRLAAVCAELVRQGVNFSVDDRDEDYVIMFSGGF